MVDQKNLRSGGASIGELLANTAHKENPYKIHTTRVVVKFKITETQAGALTANGVKEQNKALEEIEEKKTKNAKTSLLNNGVTRFDSTGQKQFDSGKRFSKKNVNAEGIVKKFSVFLKYELQDMHLFKKLGEKLFTLCLTFEMKEKGEGLSNDLSYLSSVLSQGYLEVHVWHNPDGVVTFNFVAPTGAKCSPVTLSESSGTVFLR